MSGRRRIAIVGAGLGGLTAAVALGRIGVEATVYEKAPDPQAHGGALWLWANAVNALAAVGLADRVVAAGTVVRGYEIKTWRGRLLWRFPVDRLRRDYEVPVLFVSRGDLVRILTAELDRRRLHYGARCRGFEETGAGVVPLFDETGGSPAPFDGLLGADGLHSAIRRQLLGDRPARAAGQVAWTGIAETDSRLWRLPPGEMVTYVGHGIRFTAGTADLERPGRERRVFWYSTENRSRGDRIIHPGELADLYREYQPAIAAVVERTDHPIRFPVRDRSPTARWGQGAVSLVGDAAHPSAPDIAQGACQSIEGAVVAARWLRRIDDVAEAFRAYERERMPRTARIVASSRLMNTFMRADLPGMNLVRNLGIRLAMPAWMINEYRFILDYDPGRELE